MVINRQRRSGRALKYTLSEFGTVDAETSAGIRSGAAVLREQIGRLERQGVEIRLIDLPMHPALEVSQAFVATKAAPIFRNDFGSICPTAELTTP
jgi:hypothetical protein